MTTGFAMAASIVALCVTILALVHIPELRPGADVLACDRKGGHLSRADGVCHLPDSPLAGLAS